MDHNVVDIESLQAMVTMPIGRWNRVLEILGRGVWVEVNPIIVDLHRQLQMAADAASGVPDMPPRGNKPEIVSG
jgi:hypothetical protein